MTGSKLAAKKLPLGSDTLAFCQTAELSARAETEAFAASVVGGSSVKSARCP
jgi:hypothetical protein